MRSAARRTVRALAATAAVAAVLTGCELAAPSDPGAGQGDLGEDVSFAVQAAEGFWTEQFAAGGDRFTPVGKVFGYTPGEGGGCGGEVLVPRNALYCPAGRFIAYDEEWTQAGYDQLGDAFVYYLITHEYGHAVQDLVGAQSEFTISQELQADCFAGATLGNRIRAGDLVLEDGDIDELLSGLAAVADEPGTPWFAEGAHGSVRQRTQAFANGYDREIEACSS